MTSENEKSFGVWDAIQTIFMLFIVVTAIKMIYVDAPKGLYRFFFGSCANNQYEADGSIWRCVLLVFAYVFMVLILFFIFWVADILNFAVVTLLISWCLVFVLQFLRQLNTNSAPADVSGQSRVWGIGKFLLTCYFACWVIIKLMDFIKLSNFSAYLF